LAIFAASNAPAVRSYGYISSSWYRKHLSKWAKPTGAIMGWSGTGTGTKLVHW